MGRELRQEIERFVWESPLNRHPDGSGPYFDAPLVGFASAADGLFEDYRTIIGPFHWTPTEVFEDAFGPGSLAQGTVVIWVLPVAGETRRSNRSQDRLPSLRWAHTRAYGEKFNAELRRHVVAFLTEWGHRAVAPQLSPNGRMLPETPVGLASNWSERHAAYAAGLGTALGVAEAGCGLCQTAVPCESWIPKGKTTDSVASATAEVPRTQQATSRARRLASGRRQPAGTRTRKEERPMPRVSPIDPATASPEVQAIFAEIQGAFGRLPNLFRTQAHFPPLLKADWEKVKAVMMGGSLSRKTKETIAVLVSKDNACTYCVAAHTGALKAIGVTEAEIERLEKDLDTADFTVKEKTLIRFARKANQDPNRLPEELFQAVREAGASDAEIVEALGVMEVFTAFNKFLDSLQVEVDF